MNKELAKLLRDRLLGKLNFVTKYAGLVQVVEFKQEADGGASVRKKMPVTVQSVIDGTCAQYESQMVPDSSEKGILYFEDGQTVISGKHRDRWGFQTTLTLVCWINKALFRQNVYEEITAMAINKVLEEIGAGKNPTNESFFTSLYVDPIRIPKQDAGLFRNYTYDETLTQYLRPPYEFFGIELKCSYQINPDCINEIETQETCYTPE